MRCITIILNLAVVFAFTGAYAIDSPYSTIDDFAFTRPLFTNLIKGVVMGDFSNSYSTVRYEDMAFLEEAFRERAISTVQMSHESFTNMVSATNSTLTSAIIQSPRSYLIETMLDPDLVLSDKPRVIYSTANDINNTTNLIVKIKMPNLLTNDFDHIEFITQQMKSGETDIFTNKFSEAFKSNIYDWARTSFTTNYFDFIDFCTTGVVSYISDNPYVKSNLLLNPPPTTPLLMSKKAIQNRFELMRLSNRPSPIQGSAELENIVSDSIVKQNDENPVHWTHTNNVYRVYVNCNKSYFRRQFKTDEGWVEDGDPSESSGSINDSDIPDLSQVTVNTWLPFDVLRYKLNSRTRFDYVDVYSSADIEYFKLAHSWHSTPEGSTTDTYIDTNYTATVVFPCGRYENFEATTNDMMTVKINLSNQYQEICSLSGIDYLTPDSSAALPKVGTPEWKGDDEQRIMETYQTISEGLNIKPSGTAYLFFHLTPKSTLPGWINP